MRSLVPGTKTQPGEEAAAAAELLLWRRTISFRTCFTSGQSEEGRGEKGGEEECARKVSSWGTSCFCRTNAIKPLVVAVNALTASDFASVSFLRHAPLSHAPFSLGKLLL